MNLATSKNVALSVSVVMMFLSANWLLSGAMLWWAYDIGVLVQEGQYVRSEALAQVGWMALIMTALTALVWLLVKHTTKGSQRQWQLSLSVAWKTALAQLCYAFLVLFWRNTWTPARGINDNAMFLPIVGRINGAFFKEFLWLIFVLEVVPIVGCVSGILYSLREGVVEHFRPHLQLRGSSS